MKDIEIAGRVLYLSQSADVVRRQLAGENLDRAEAGALRDNISTDEITPVTVMLTHDERLGRFPYVGFEVEGVKPIAADAVRQGGFGVVVAGKRYGKGSSRESSPLAELYAGIRLVVAESFERIYQQNCDNLGLLTSTDFGLLDRIAAGESIPIEEFMRGRDPLTQQVIRAGGLLDFSKTVDWSSAAPDVPAVPQAPRTLVEKIIERGLHPSTPSLERGQGVFVRCDWRFSHDYFTGMAAHFMHRGFGRPSALQDPSTIIAFQDHLVLASQSIPHVRGGLLPGIRDLTSGHEDFVSLYPVRRHGKLDGEPGAEGICHALMAEKYALPGQVVVGTDSHTPHSGALGCLAFGVGATEVANSWVTGYARCKVPDTVRVEVTGRLRPGVMAKDVVLHLLRMDAVKNGGAIGAVFEFCGSAVRAMGIDERATLTNMVAELGGFTGIVEPDQKTIDFLRERRGVEVALEDWMRSDEGADYRSTILIDGDSLGPMLAKPGDPGNGVTIAETARGAVPVTIAYGGSCTGGKQEDFDRYHEVLSWALKHDRRVAAHVRLYLQYGTSDVRAYCEERGYNETFRAVGAEIVLPGCGACANCGPGQSLTQEDVTISAINRNFPGRSGPGKVWLASPATVAASAIAGHIASFDELLTTGGGEYLIPGTGVGVLPRHSAARSTLEAFMGSTSLGANVVVDALIEAGVDTFFANPGTSEIHLVSAIDRHPRARAVLCLFEGVATGAADGYARACGKPAAVLLHLGPGLANGLANLHNASKARSPMIVLVGEHASRHLAYDTPLKSDLDAIAGFAAKAVVHMRPGDDLAAMTRHAVAVSLMAPRGPVVVVANADVMWSEADVGIGAGPASASVQSPSFGDGLAAREALDFLRRPGAGMILGGEALGAEGIALADSLAQSTGCAVFCETFNARHERGEGIPHVERLPYFREAAMDRLAAIGHLLLVGSRPPVAFFGGLDGESVLSMPEAGILSSAPAQSPVALLKKMAALSTGLPAPRGSRRSESMPPSGPLTPKAVWATVNRLLPEGAIVSDEAGVSSVGADEALRGARRHTWLNLTGGSIGQGLPVGTGAAVARPDARVFVFHGDGGAMYTIQSLWTQARERARVVNIVLRNDRYAILDHEVKRHGLGPLGSKGASMFSLSDPALDWSAIAQGLGVGTFTATTAEEFDAAFTEALGRSGPVLIEARMAAPRRFG